MKTKLLALFLIITLNSTWAQQPNDSIVLRNVKIMAGGGAVVYAGSMVALNQLWFKDCPWVGFHTINDNSDWLQMDKFGHATTAYHINLLGNESLRLIGLDAKQSALYSGAFSLLYMTSIELMDAGYEGWGFSWGDMAADLGGTTLYTVQQLLWTSNASA